MVNGGDWYGTDGSGVPQGATQLINAFEGAGSVFTAVDQTIVLRNNNGEWVDDFYVTAPEQRIAARKLASSAVRRKTN